MMRSAIFATVAAAATLALASAAFAADTVRSMQAVTHEVDARPVVAYFVPEAGRCAVTVMMDERAEAEGADASAPAGARFSVSLEPGAGARVSGGNGDDLRLACAESAGAMTAEMRSGSRQVAAR